MGPARVHVFTFFPRFALRWDAHRRASSKFEYLGENKQESKNTFGKGPDGFESRKNTGEQISWHSPCDIYTAVSFLFVDPVQLFKQRCI